MGIGRNSATGRYYQHGSGVADICAATYSSLRLPLGILGLILFTMKARHLIFLPVLLLPWAQAPCAERSPPARNGAHDRVRNPSRKRRSSACSVTLSGMDTAQLISEIDSEISSLQQARALLAGAGSDARVKGHGRKRVMSAEARAKIAAAQKRRWAKQRQETKKTT